MHEAMTDSWSLLFVVGLMAVSGIVAACLYRLPPVEVPEEERCPGCGRWIGHRWRCPER